LGRKEYIFLSPFSAVIINSTELLSKLISSFNTKFELAFSEIFIDFILIFVSLIGRFTIKSIFKSFIMAL
jgi:hypothetical protein